MILIANFDTSLSLFKFYVFDKELKHNFMKCIGMLFEVSYLGYFKNEYMVMNQIDRRSEHLMKSYKYGKCSYQRFIHKL